MRRGLFKSIKDHSCFMKGTMLDFGCGTKPYKPLFDVDLYIGLDIEDCDNEYFAEHVDVLYNGTSLPFKDESFDSILATEVIEHIFEIDSLLTELFRILKKSSYMLITCPFVWEEHEIPNDYARYTSYGISYLLQKHGFEIIKKEKTTNYVETIFQMWLLYLHQYVLPRNKYLRFLLSTLMVPTINFVALTLGYFLPYNNKLYNNNVIVVQRSL